MSIGLSELGNELCQEFDYLNTKLGDLRSETLTLLREYRSDLRSQSEADIANHSIERAHMREDIQTLLSKYRNERRKCVQSLAEDRKAQHLEMQTLANERKEDFRGWNKAIHYLRKKRTGR